MRDRIVARATILSRVSENFFAFLHMHFGDEKSHHHGRTPPAAVPQGPIAAVLRHPVRCSTLEHLLSSTRVTLHIELRWRNRYREIGFDRRRCNFNPIFRCNGLKAEAYRSWKDYRRCCGDPVGEDWNYVITCWLLSMPFFFSCFATATSAPTD